MLGIPRDAEVVLFVADHINEQRKGFSQLAQTLADLSHRSNLYVVSLGQGASTTPLPLLHLHLGHIGNDRLLSLVYSAADVFVTASLQDNLAQTVLEAIACAVPVVGFDVVRSKCMQENRFGG